MSTAEVTPESLRAHAEWLDDHNGAAEARALRLRATRLEREQRPLPTEPGWYANVVVERGGESCTGALLTDEKYWETPRRIGGKGTHYPHERGLTIRWSEQDGKTPGQTAYEADAGGAEWSAVSQSVRNAYECEAAAVLAAHGTPTLSRVRGACCQSSWTEASRGTHCSITFARTAAWPLIQSSLTLARAVRMSDDLTPSEQARAARWARGWLHKCRFEEYETAQDAMRALGFHADKMDLSETVESLRAERDKALAALNASLADVHHWQEQFRLVCDESACRLGDRNVAREKLAQAECVIRDHIAALDSIRAERDKALADCEELAVRLGFERTDPRVWKRGDPEPDVATRVRDKQGDVWNWRGGGWTCRRDRVVGAADWETVLIFAPLTEVLDED